MLKLNYFTLTIFSIFLVAKAQVTIINVTNCTPSKIDIGFIVDESGSIGSTNFNIVLEFLKQVINGMEVGPTKSRIAMNRFNTRARVDFNLNSYTLKSQYISAIDSISYRGGGTNIPTGLRLMFDNQFTTANGRRDNVKNIFVLITDGRGGDFAPVMQELNNANIELIAVGVGGNVDPKLELSVKKPEYYIPVPNFQMLLSILDNFLNVVCEVQQIFIEQQQEPKHECENCNWNGNTGYLPDANDCSKYKLCIKLPNQEGETKYNIITMNCAPGTYWNQDYLTCAFTKSQDCQDKGVAGPGNNVVVPNYQPCSLRASSESDKQYFNGDYLMTCAPGTKFSLESCSCIIDENDNGASTCEKNLIVYLPFNNDKQDHSCNRAFVQEHGGNGLLTSGKKSKSLSFTGSNFYEVPLLSNYFNNKQVNQFTMALYMKSGRKLSQNIEGLLTNAYCNLDPVFQITIGGGNVVSASLNTDAGSVKVQSYYNENVWTHVAAVYNKQTFVLYINGVAKSTGWSATGNLRNNKCPLVVGFMAQTTNHGLFNGQMDEVKVYEKALTQYEIQQLL